MGAQWYSALVSVDITPPAGLTLAGYADRRGRSTGTIDGLEATLWLLRGSDRATLCWVGIDALAITEALRVAIVDRLLGAHPGWHHVLVSATHTHSAPDGWHGTVHPVLPAQFDERLVGALVERLVEASHRLHPRPARLTTTDMAIEGLATNRHDPEMAVDNTARVVRVHRGSDLGGLVVQTACHPTVLGPGNLDYCADWVGGMRRALRAHHPDLPVLLLQGAAGDLSTRFTREAATPAEADRLGALVAAGVRHPGRPWVEVPAAGIDTHQTIITLRARERDAPTSTRDEPLPWLPGGGVGDRLDDATAQTCAAPPGPGALGLARARRDARRAAQALAAAKVTEIMVPVSLISMGALRWLVLPLELGNQWGAMLNHDGDLRVVGYTDGYAGYVVDRAAHEAGHYEAAASFLDAEASDDLMCLLRHLIGG